jgi:pSer/pThr/pTyr-binding forkhead associated (FHA) protein
LYSTLQAAVKRFAWETSLQSAAASRTHAQIFFENERFYIKDLSSTLGTFVNGSRIETCELHHEDEITIGDQTMLFVQDVSPRLNSDARRRRKEFETVWEQLTSSARDE